MSRSWYINLELWKSRCRSGRFILWGGRIPGVVTCRGGTRCMPGRRGKRFKGEKREERVGRLKTVVTRCKHWGGSKLSAQSCWTASRFYKSICCASITSRLFLPLACQVARTALNTACTYATGCDAVIVTYEAPSQMFGV
jgi:hypothetical protein